MQENKKHQWEKIKTANVVGILIVIFCALFLITLLIVEVPSNNKDIVNFLSGTFFGAALNGVMFYYFNYKKQSENE